MIQINSANLSKNIVNVNELLIISIEAEEILAKWINLWEVYWEALDSNKTWQDVELFIF